MIENFLAGSAALFGDPFTIGIFVFGVVGGMLFRGNPRGQHADTWPQFCCPLPRVWNLRRV